MREPPAERRGRYVRKKDCPVGIMARGDGKERTDRLVEDIELFDLYQASDIYFTRRHIGIYSYPRYNVSTFPSCGAMPATRRAPKYSIHTPSYLLRPTTSHMLAEWKLTSMHLLPVSEEPHSLIFWDPVTHQ